MKPKMPVVLFVFIFILLLVSSLSCQNDNEEDNLSDMSAPKLQAVYSTPCKENSKGRVIESYIQLKWLTRKIWWSRKIITSLQLFIF